MKKVLFACYGSGHVRMVLPVAKALRERGLAEVQVLGLTTAAPVVRDAGLPLVQFKDVVAPGDAGALAEGQGLAQALGAVADPDESAAYLGLSFAELVQDVGAEEARRRYAERGRQAFLPVRTLHRILERTRPDLVVVTNSPRAERAAAIAARERGIPCVCLVDLFCIDEVQWIGEPGYADLVCVLNESVRRFLLDAGRRPDEVVVTGNPAFDVINSQANRDAGRALRERHGWQGRRVLLWPNQVEPAVHPFDGRPADPGLPARAFEQLQRWVLARQDTVLCVRPRPGEAPPALAADPRLVLTGQDWPLHPLLHAVDLVVTLNSTVGLEGRLAGCRLVQVLGSVFDAAMPLARYGLADEAVPLDRLAPALDRWSAAPRHADTAEVADACGRVVGVLQRFL
jgi:hypothetical protein